MKVDVQSFWLTVVLVQKFDTKVVQKITIFLHSTCAGQRIAQFQG
jgi:hypothetical protein